MDELRAWLIGHLSPAERIVGAVGPAILLVAYFLIGVLIFNLRGGRARFHDAEAESRRTGMSSAGMRVFFAWLMSPLLRLMLRAGLPPNAITSVSVAFSFAAAVALAAGRFSLGGWLYFLAGACDFFDGRVARAQNRASPGGAALDSILDRYTEAAVLVGLAWYYQGTWVLFAVLLAIVGSLLVPYVRARGEALHATMAEVGVFQRPERVVLLGTTVALSPILEVFLHARTDHPMHWLAVAGIVAIAAGTQFTAFQRTRYLVRTLSDHERDSSVSPSKRAWIRAAVASFLATAVDAGLVALLAIKGDIALPIATGLGCLVGGFTNFTLNRNWSFSGAASLSLSGQAARYAFVSLSSALFNAGGVAVMMLLPHIADPLIWLLVRAAVWWAWTYPMFRDYVFDAFRRPAAVEGPRGQREEPRTSVA